MPKWRAGNEYYTRNSYRSRTDHSRRWHLVVCSGSTRRASGDVLKVRQVRGKPYTPWEVAVPVSITGTRRIRKYFSTREEAESYLVRVKSRGFAGANQRAESGKLTLGECADIWLARHEGKERATYFQVRRILASLRGKFDREAIEFLTHRELEAWLASIGGSETNRQNYYRIARRFFHFVQIWLEAIPRNPFDKIERLRREHQEPPILTPALMRKCLGAASDIRLKAYLCLGGFAGLRTSEIIRFQWEDISWERGEIFVRQPKRVKGWRPRYVDILPSLRRHLEPLALKSGPILTLGKGAGGMRTLYILRKAMMNQIGMARWPLNCLRHSYKTYHAAHFQDLSKLQLQMGHSDANMTRYAYGTPEARAVAEQWWNL